MSFWQLKYMKAKIYAGPFAVMASYYIAMFLV